MHMEQLPPKVAEPPKADEGMSVEALIKELSMAAARQATLIAQLKVQYASEGSSGAQKDEEIALQRAQLASAQAEVESSNAYAGKLADERISLFAQVKQEHVAFDQYKSNCIWGVRYLEQNKYKHFSQLDAFRKDIEEKLARQEEKLRKLSIEYDEELYLHLVYVVAERRYPFFCSYECFKLTTCNFFGRIVL